MTYETAISALDAAQTGDEMLQVLDTLMTDLQASSVPTLEPMEF